MLCPEDEQIFAYRRYLDDQEMLVVCNFSDQEVLFEVPDILKGKEGSLLIGNYAEAVYGEKMLIRPYEARVYCY